MTSPTQPTADERRAIASLERLAKRWPETLMLFSWSGTLCVVKLKEDGSSPLHDGDPNSHVVATIHGITNDGGDA
jgi:hypothetical protein